MQQAELYEDHQQISPEPPVRNSQVCSLQWPPAPAPAACAKWPELSFVRELFQGDTLFTKTPTAPGADRLRPVVLPAAGAVAGHALHELD